VEGLALYARLGHGPHLDSSLAIRMTEGGRRRFESELDPDYYSRRDDELPSDLIAHARVSLHTTFPFGKPQALTTNLRDYLTSAGRSRRLPLFSNLQHWWSTTN
jgi:hypothetical protein